MLAAPALIDRLMTNYWAGVSRKGNRIIPRCRPNKKRKGHLSPQSGTNICNLPPFRPPFFSLVTAFTVKQLGSCVIIIQSGEMAFDDHKKLA